MQRKDPEMKKLIKQYFNVIMPNPAISKTEARSVLEYLRQVAAK